MAFAGILKEEDITAAVQACLGLLKDIIPIETYTNRLYRLIQQLLHAYIQTAFMYAHTPSLPWVLVQELGAG